MNVWLLRRSVAAAAIVACSLLAGGCNPAQKTSGAAPPGAVLEPPAGLGLQPVAMPDTSKMEPPSSALEPFSMKSAIEKAHPHAQPLAAGFRGSFVGRGLL
jgi:hypothetical protein